MLVAAILLQSRPVLAAACATVATHASLWHAAILSADSLLDWQPPIDGPPLPALYKLCLIRIVAPSRLCEGVRLFARNVIDVLLTRVAAHAVLAAVSQFTGQRLGPFFLDHHGYDIRESLADATPQAPLVFLLVPGSDPLSDIVSLASRLGPAEPTRALQSVSLGQGQAASAEKAIATAAVAGSWVLLQVFFCCAAPFSLHLF
jgi:hypothetical protein